ncbi:MAG: hypothetical protein ACYS32_00565 [Planctomycetota bacterium]|jgi:hypothetical protein
MRQILFALTIVLMLMLTGLQSAIPADITLAWDPNEEPEVIGYNIYFRNHINEDYRFMAEILEQDFDNPLQPTIGIWGLSEILTYHFVATAFSTDEESDYSNSVIWSAPPEPPTEPPPAPAPPAGSGGGGCFISSIQEGG